jgi:hypothetical protein
MVQVLEPEAPPNDWERGGYPIPKMEHEGLANNLVGSARLVKVFGADGWD